MGGGEGRVELVLEGVGLEGVLPESVLLLEWEGVWQV